MAFAAPAKRPPVLSRHLPTKMFSRITVEALARVRRNQSHGEEAPAPMVALLSLASNT
jgi:hypothetical protein